MKVDLIFPGDRLPPQLVMRFYCKSRINPTQKEQQRCQYILMIITSYNQKALLASNSNEKLLSGKFLNTSKQHCDKIGLLMTEEGLGEEAQRKLAEENITSPYLQHQVSIDDVIAFSYGHVATEI